MSDECILVAEDDPIIRRETVNALRPFGYCLLEAVDGQEGSTSQISTKVIDLLITNIRMPRMQGHELARRIKRLRPNICSLIVSGRHEEEFPPEAVSHSDFLLKPFVQSGLVEKVRRLLSEPSGSAHLTARRR